MKTLFTVFALLFCASLASAGCRQVRVDDDHNASTPAVQKQDCDSSPDEDREAPPGKSPVQKPGIKPDETPTGVPGGITSCRRETVYDSGGWVTRTVCTPATP
jgi:hypothetical protein